MGREVGWIGKLIIQVLDSPTLPAMMTTGKREPRKWGTRAYDVSTPYFPHRPAGEVTVIRQHPTGANQSWLNVASLVNEPSYALSD